jgi:HEAT repeat protein
MLRVLEWFQVPIEESARKVAAAHEDNPVRAPNQPVRADQSLSVEIETEPNNSWREANPIHLGSTVFGSADDGPYIPLAGQSDKESVAEGEDWFRFEFTGDKPQLAFFNIDLDERDNIPADVSIFCIKDGQLKPYEEGTDPVTPSHEVQALEANKFTTRVLREKGTYYVRVLANHPFYQLRTAVYDVPPYSDPRQAVRTAVDYILAAGDSWHANTPRKGGIYNRVANVHAETMLCVACHPTHFALRAQLYALQNGYPVRERPQLQFLTERFYNNPRPFYGHPGATWARVISAPANVLSRMAALLEIYEREITGEHRAKFFKGIGEYLKLYYKARAKLPSDESNGNTPIVSTYEVAWYSWVALDNLSRRSGDKSYLEARDRVRRLMEQGEHKNMLDLCYQTLAFCTIDRRHYDQRIRENCQRIFSYQRPSGQWAMNFDPDAPEAEFQTGHCLWVLAAAGYKPEDPRIARAVHYLLGRQQSFGGWFDPLQSYENFRTPFRETQMAVLAFSTFYKGPPIAAKGTRSISQASNPAATRRPNRAAGSLAKSPAWGVAFPAPPNRLNFTHIERLLTDLDNIWDPPNRLLLADLIAATRHPEVLVRREAVASLGRVGNAAAVPSLRAALGDPSKIVQRAAALSLRQLASRKQIGLEAISSALSDKNDRVRWGATRTFAAHFSFLTNRIDLAEKVMRAAHDPVVTVRMQALKGLWQWWYWSDNENLRSRIEDVFIGRLAEAEHPWVRRNLQEGLYNIADENIRYLYNNWIPLLGTTQDRERAIGARLAVENRIARKAAQALSSGNELQREGVSRGLAEFHLRNANSYSLEPARQPSQRTGAQLYVRIGNDIETTQFFGRSADVLAKALVPLLESSSKGMRRLATQASLMLREVRMPKSYGSADTSGIRDVVRLAEIAQFSGPKSSDNSPSYGVSRRPEPSRQLLAAAVYRRLIDPDKDMRTVAAEVYKSFSLDIRNTENLAVLDELLASPYREAQVAALETIAAAESPLQDSKASDHVKRVVLAGDAGILPVALAALKSVPALQRDGSVVAQFEKALVSQDLRTFRAAVELSLKAKEIPQSDTTRTIMNRAFTVRDAHKRKVILDLANGDRSLLDDGRVLSLLNEALLDRDPSVVSAALELVRQERRLQKNPAILAALGELRDSPKVTANARFLADALYSGRKVPDSKVAQPGIPAATPVTPFGPVRVLDYAYFANRVQPILETPGRDGNACVQCHATHAIFRLNPPNPDRGYSEEELREHYRSALRVVNLLEPEKSLVLLKPTSTSEAEGLVGTDRIAHGGGVRWFVNSVEYRTILDWIRGATLVSSEQPRK